MNGMEVNNGIIIDGVLHELIKRLKEVNYEG